MTMSFQKSLRWIDCGLLQKRQNNLPPCRMPISLAGLTNRTRLLEQLISAHGIRHFKQWPCLYIHIPGSNKSLARPARKQARKHVRDARDFNNIETRAVKFFFPPARQGTGGNSRHCDRNICFYPSWSG